MRRKLLLILALSMTFILSACGMSSEEIATYMTSLETSYQNGAYEQAQSEVKKLEKSTKNMTEEQKTKFDELKSSVEYAVTSSAAINEGLNNAQSDLDKKMYYEAVQELDKLTATYTMPPAEQKKYDEKKTAADNGIKTVKATEALQKVETVLGSGDYNAASNELGNVDTSALSEEQKQKYQSLQTQIAEAKAKAEAEAKAKAEAEAKAKAGISVSEARAIVQKEYPEPNFGIESVTEENIGNDTIVYNVIVGGIRGFRESVYVDKKTGEILGSQQLPHIY